VSREHKPVQLRASHVLSLEATAAYHLHEGSMHWLCQACRRCCQNDQIVPQTSARPSTCLHHRDSAMAHPARVVDSVDAMPPDRLTPPVSTYSNKMTQEGGWHCSIAILLFESPKSRVSLEQPKERRRCSYVAFKREAMHNCCNRPPWLKLKPSFHWQPCPPQSHGRMDH
jgi:hypothetical protein